MLEMITSKSKTKQASRNQVGLTFGVGLTFKVLSSKWGLLSGVGLTFEWAYYRINTVIGKKFFKNNLFFSMNLGESQLDFCGTTQCLFQ